MAKNKQLFKVMAAAAVMSSVVAPYVVNAEAVTTSAKTSFTEQNVAFDFSAGTEADSYLKAFITSANLVFDADGKPYAEITFGGHSYAATALKIGSATGADVEITKSTGSVATKDLVRVVKVALDAEYKASVYVESGQRGTYIFNFDFLEEKTKFTFTSGTDQDAYFSAWVPSADLATDANGKKYAYITLAGHSYAIGAIKVGAATGTAAQVIKTTGSADTKDLVRVVRLPLDENNKGSLYLAGGERGSYTFSFDFSKKDAVKIEDVLTTNAQEIAFKYTADVSWHPMAFAANVKAATAKKVSGGYEVSLTLVDNVTAFTATQAGKEIAAFKEGSKAVTFTVSSLEGISFKATSTSDRGATETTVNVSEFALAEKTTGANPFTDIDNVSTKAEILALYHAGITTGTTPTTFSPNNNMTRAQFAQMITRALDLKPTKATNFKDIKGKPYENAVQALFEAGIIKGVSADTFNPGAAVTRQQAALMITRMLEYKGYKVKADTNDLRFKDQANISAEAKQAFAELQKTDILTGSDGYAKPYDLLKRAQMAKILKRALDLIGFIK